MIREQTKVLVVGIHTEETLSRIRALPDCRLVLAEDVRAVRPEDLADAEILVGSGNPLRNTC